MDRKRSAIAAFSLGLMHSPKHRLPASRSGFTDGRARVELHADSTQCRLQPAARSRKLPRARFAPRSKAGQPPGSCATAAAKRCGVSPTPTATTWSTCGATSTTVSSRTATSTPTSTARPTSTAGSKPAARGGASTRTKTAASTIWQVISAPEVAEELVLALKSRDRAAVRAAADHAARVGGRRLRPSTGGTARGDAEGGSGRILEARRRAEGGHAAERICRLLPHAAGHDPGRHRGFDQRHHDPRQRLGAGGQPATSTSRSYLGTLVAVGNTWKLIDVPTIGSDNQPAPGGLLTPNIPDDAGSHAATPAARRTKCRN